MTIQKTNLKFSGTLSPIKKVTKIVVHHPAHPTWDVYEVHNYHKAKGWSGIGYNYFITKGGVQQEGRGKYIGAHCVGKNSYTLGVSFQGDFDKQELGDMQLKAGANLIAKLLREYGLQINDVVRHKDLAATDCPGKNFRFDDLKTAILHELNPNTIKHDVPKQQVENVQPKQEDLPKVTSLGDKYSFQVKAMQDTPVYEYANLSNRKNTLREGTVFSVYGYTYASWAVGGGGFVMMKHVDPVPVTLTTGGLNKVMEEEFRAFLKKEGIAAELNLNKTGNPSASITVQGLDLVKVRQFLDRKGWYYK